MLTVACANRTWERYTCETDCANFPETCISEELIRTTADAMAAEGLVAAGYDYIQIDDCWAAQERDAAGAIVPDPIRFPGGMKALAVRLCVAWRCGLPLPPLPLSYLALPLSLSHTWHGSQRLPLSHLLTTARRRMQDYVATKGMKLGLYGDIGSSTCGGFIGFNISATPDAVQDAKLAADGSSSSFCMHFRELFPSVFVLAFRTVETMMGWGMASLKVDGCNADFGGMNVT